MLAVAIVLRWSSLVPWAIFVTGAGYVGGHAGTNVVDGWAAAIGVLLLLAAELAIWSIEHDARIAEERSLTTRRITTLCMPRRGRAADELPAARHRRDLSFRERRARRGGRRRGGQRPRGRAATDAGLSCDLRDQETVMNAVRDWLCPFASFSVATTVYVCPLTGTNDGVKVTDWSACERRRRLTDRDRLALRVRGEIRHPDRGAGLRVVGQVGHEHRHVDRRAGLDRDRRTVGQSCDRAEAAERRLVCARLGDQAALPRVARAVAERRTR